MDNAGAETNNHFPQKHLKLLVLAGIAWGESLEPLKKKEQGILALNKHN